MKLKYDGTGIEITDRDSKNLISLMDYWVKLPEEDKKKVLQLILGSMGTATYFAIIYTIIKRRET